MTIPCKNGCTPMKDQTYVLYRQCPQCRADLRVFYGVAEFCVGHRDDYGVLVKPPCGYKLMGG